MRLNSKNDENAYRKSSLICFVRKVLYINWNSRLLFLDSSWFCIWQFIIIIVIISVIIAAIYPFHWLWQWCMKIECVKVGYENWSLKNWINSRCVVYLTHKNTRTYAKLHRVSTVVKLTWLLRETTEQPNFHVNHDQQKQQRNIRTTYEKRNI